MEMCLICVSGHCEQDSAVPVRCFEEFQIGGKKTDCLEIGGWFFKDKDDVVCAGFCTMMEMHK